MTTGADRHVVIVGAGFGGLEAARHLAGVPVRITMIDRRNHHLFQPLLYQVATASLPTSEIAWPIRSLLRGHRNVTTLLGSVTGVDRGAKTVLLDGEPPIAFDTLILATGARHAYFGHDEWEPYAPGVKTLEDATRIRRRILFAFEQAEWESDADGRAPWLTFVIIGAGPTGVELAGTIAELAHDTLRGDFRNFDTRSARVILVEAGPRILAGFTEDLSAYAERALKRLGVEVMLGQPVSDCREDGIVLGGAFLPARTVLWAAGVAASPAAEWLEAPADRAGRVRVEPDLSVPGEPEIFVIGDTAFVAGADGKPVPGVAPAAKQEGGYVAQVIKARLQGKPAPGPFAYKNAGNLATIGKRAAIVDFGWIKLRGRLAWWIWGIAHIFFLIGLRNRLAVALNWLWIYVSGHRSARLITQGQAGTARKAQ
ncbi:NAD(P)/FAD-dependent oxidoreductase [Bosea minatitlanensis]|uniref:NADH:ubiquinone reductase (non-electrogenic) n=1 Tax=Bosea minatitlanensis TaxID=128782 RepID=A0ABW0F1E6_9HYPH|nr:NAD(P)/FAD-dependent oxidoreductase [Bosea minatitlanensis]MCT4492031.1 NAD(P)/FAD-dependent oxidoreductase [Bosea minatitlanensis]